MALPMSQTISATMTRPPQDETVAPGTCSALALEEARWPNSTRAPALDEAPLSVQLTPTTETHELFWDDDDDDDDDDVVPPNPPPTRTQEFIESVSTFIRNKKSNDFQCYIFDLLT